MLAIVSREHRAVALPATADLVNLFPHAQPVTLAGSSYLVFPHEPRGTIALRKLGHNVPAPVLSHFDWGAAKVPYEAQRQTVAMMTSSYRGYVLNSFGTGKTSTALWAIKYLKQTGAGHKALVIAPLSTLRLTWQHEVLSTTPDLKVIVLHHASRKRRLELLAQDADVYVVNHDGLKLIRKEIEARPDIDMLVLDELAVYRNPSAQRSKVMRKFVQRFQWAWGMTGSPTPNDPTDAWSQCAIITPNSVPKFFTRFRDETMIKVSTFKWVPKNNALETVFKAMQPAVRFTLDDMVEMPDMVERVVDVAMGVKQQKVYDMMRAHAYAAIQAQEITAANEGAIRMKLLQISAGWVYDSKRGVVRLDGDKRLDTLVDMLEDVGEKAIVFVPFLHALDGIVEHLTMKGISVAKVSGQTSMDERGEIFNAFQTTDKPRIVVAHPRCMHHGLTLTAARTIIWYAPSDSVEMFEQANARIRRISQTGKQQIVMLQGTAVERKSYARLRSKQKVQGLLLEMFEEHS